MCYTYVVLEITCKISKFQDASSAVHKLHEEKIDHGNYITCYLWQQAAEVHLEFNGGFKQWLNKSNIL